VEVWRRYSNRPELLKPLVSALSKIHNDVPDDAHASQTVATARPDARPTRLADRLSAADVQRLIEEYQTATAPQLAKKYGIGLTSVKKLLCQSGARKRQQ